MTSTQGTVKPLMMDWGSDVLEVEVEQQEAEMRQAFELVEELDGAVSKASFRLFHTHVSSNEERDLRAELASLHASRRRAFEALQKLLGCNPPSGIKVRR